MASVCWKLSSVVSLALTVIVLPVTPRQVEPPLDPANCSHGGEYGSPFTWGPLHATTRPGEFTVCPAVPAVPPVAPAAPGVVAVGTVGTACWGVMIGPENETCLGTTLGTRSAIVTTTRAMTAAGA